MKTITLQIKRKNLIDHLTGKSGGIEWRKPSMHYHRQLYNKVGEREYSKKEITKVKFIVGMSQNAPYAIFNLKRFDLYEFVTTGELYGKHHEPGTFTFLFELGELIECNIAAT